MNVQIVGELKEIAALVMELQERHADQPATNAEQGTQYVNGTFCVMLREGEAFGGSFSNMSSLEELITRYGNGNSVEVTIRCNRSNMGQ